MRIQRICLTVAVVVVLTRSLAAQTPPRVLNADWRTDWDIRSIELAELEANVPRDAIPSIDAPRFASITAAADWIGKDEPVLVLSYSEETKAYPLQILIWHELVNDRIGDVPVAVTFCPLCYSAMVLDRRIDGEEYHFGVSGMLRYSDLVMYDRETHSLWQQLNGDAIVGVFTGKKLRQMPAQIVSFEQFIKAYPSGKVLSRETGYARRYGENPYPGYDDIDDKPWAFREDIDARLPPMEKVTALQIGKIYKAYPHSISRNTGLIQEQVGDINLVLFHTRNGATSSVDKTSIATSKVIGTTGVFNAMLSDGSVLTFSARGDSFVDNQTGSEWSITGNSYSGPMSGTQLVPIVHTNMFAFAWLVVHPESLIYVE